MARTSSESSWSAAVSWRAPQYQDDACRPQVSDDINGIGVHEDVRADLGISSSSSSTPPLTLGPGAKAAGVNVGDRLLAVNEVEVTGQEALFKQLKGIADGANVAIKVAARV